MQLYINIIKLHTPEMVERGKYCCVYKNIKWHLFLAGNVYLSIPFYKITF